MPSLYADQGKDKGKGGGCKPRNTSNRCSGGGEDTFASRDIREGQGTLVTKPNGPRPNKFICPTCDLARELVSKAFNLGKSRLSCGVSSIDVMYFT